MTISASDISIVLSGGLSNTDPKQSFGGDASLFPIGNDINNLFSDVTATQSSTGYTDYRCIYVVNNSAVDSFFNVVFSLSGDSVGSTLDFGVLARNEVQKITINGSPTGGYLVIKYENALSPHIAWNASTTTFAANLQNGLNSTSGLSQVICTVGANSSEFLIQFTGNDGNRNQNLLTLDTNAFTPSVANPVFTTVTQGGPKNDIAVNVSNVATMPNGVVFTNNSIIINTIRPEEIVPLWFRRNTGSGISAVANDSAELTISGTVFA